MERASCHTGTPPEGMRDIMTMEDENGIILDHIAMGVSGLAAAAVAMIKDRTIGIVIGSISDCASWGSSFTTLPTAANREA